MERIVAEEPKKNEASQRVSDIGVRDEYDLLVKEYHRICNVAHTLNLTFFPSSIVAILITGLNFYFNTNFALLVPFILFWSLYNTIKLTMKIMELNGYGTVLEKRINEIQQKVILIDCQHLDKVNNFEFWGAIVQIPLLTPLAFASLFFYFRQAQKLYSEGYPNNILIIGLSLMLLLCIVMLVIMSIIMFNAKNKTIKELSLLMFDVPK